MNIAELEKRLLAIARDVPVDDSVPYAFEHRIMARLAHSGGIDLWNLWSRALWPAAVLCVSITVCVCAWSFLSDRNGTSHESLSADLENTVLAAVDHGGETW